MTWEEISKELFEKRTAKRFEVYKVIGRFHEWSIEDTVDDRVVFGSIMHKYEADRLCEKLNELHEENKRLRKCINEIYTIARLEEV